MSIAATWDNMHCTTLRYIHYGRWTWADLDAAIEEAHSLFRSVRYGIHTIVDLRESGPLPGQDLGETRRPLSLAPRRDTYLILVGDTIVTRPFYNAIRKVYLGRRGKDKLIFVETIEEARELLEELSERALAHMEPTFEPAFV